MSPEDELSRLLQAERAVHVPRAAVDQGWQRLTHSLAAQIAPLPIASGPLKLGLATFPKWLLVGFAVGLVGASATASVLSPRPPQASAKQPVIVAVPRAVRQAAVAPSLQSASEGQALPPASMQRVAPALAASSAAPSATAPFDAELALISSAKAELEARRPVQARALLAQHAARFPNGFFAIERDALEILASCGPGPRGAAQVQRFAEQHPGSPLVARLQRACGNGASVTSSEKSRQASAVVDSSRLPNEPPEPEERTVEPKAGERQ